MGRSSAGTLHSTYDLLLQHDVVIAGELGVREVGSGGFQWLPMVSMAMGPWGEPLKIAGWLKVNGKIPSING